MALWSKKSVVASWQWLMSASARAGRIARLIARPESMTAYATLAAALAAFLSLKAAERQERATFTSNLYNKQVETIALFTERYIAFITNVYSFYENNDNVRNELWKSTEPLHLALSNATIILEVLYPKETERFMKELSSAESSVWISLGDAPTGPMSESRKKESKQFDQFVSQLLLCSREQLREGANLEGWRFAACVEVKQSGG
jgi:hypothetical protein